MLLLPCAVWFMLRKNLSSAHQYEAASSKVFDRVFSDCVVRFLIVCNFLFDIAEAQPFLAHLTQWRFSHLPLHFGNAWIGLIVIECEFRGDILKQKESPMASRTIKKQVNKKLVRRAGTSNKSFTCRPQIVEGFWPVGGVVSNQLNENHMRNHFPASSIS